MKRNAQIIIGTAPWWISTLPQKPKKKSFSANLKDFLKHVSFHGYSMLVETGSGFREKFFWFLFHVAAITVLTIFLINTQETDDERLSNTIFDPAYEIQNVPFPAVTICSANRISNTSATQYAVELNEKDPLKRGVNYFYGQIKMLSFNYIQEGTNFDYNEALNFQTFLDNYDRKDDDLFYDTARRMKMLSPKCEDILLKCRLGGKEINCSQEFQVSLTSHGFCCTFNHDGRYSGHRTFRNRFFGSANGLLVLLNACLKDDFFKIFAMNGFLTYIHAPKNFPESSSGSVQERIIKAGIDSLVPVKATMIETLPEARYLKPSKRNCLFENEMRHIFEKGYSFNKCITRCRIRSILILCQCLLFNNPYEFLNLTSQTVYCTLQHQDCLRHYDCLPSIDYILLAFCVHIVISLIVNSRISPVKWLNVITHRESVRGLEREMEDALYCPDCLPSCSETRYRATVLGLPLRSDSIRTFSDSIDPRSLDLAMLRVYFADTHVRYYKRILKYSWFEIFSKIGNICGCIAGFSLIGIMEWIFFFVQELYEAYRNEISSENVNQRNGPVKEDLIILP